MKKRAHKRKGEKHACKIYWLCSFPGVQPAFSLLVVICCCYGENKSISHGYQPVPCSGSAPEIQDQVLNYDPKQESEKRIWIWSLREFFMVDRRGSILHAFSLLEGRHIDLFTFFKRTKCIMNREVGW